MKLLKRLFLFIMVLGFAIKPVLAVTYHFYQGVNNYADVINMEDLNVGDIVKPSDVFNFKNWRIRDYLATSLTINYFEEEADEAFTYVDNYDDTLPTYTTNVYSDTVNDFSTNSSDMNEHNFTIKTIEQTGLNIPSSKDGIPFYGWKVAYLKPSQYHSSVSFVNLVPNYDYDHEIVSHPTTSNPTFNVTNDNQVSNYYFAQFDKIDGLKYYDYDNSTTYYNSMVGTDILEDLPNNITTTRNSIKINSIVSNDSELSSYFELVGYFEIEDDNNISININNASSYDALSYVYISIYDVSKEVSDKSLYDQEVEKGFDGFAPEEVINKMKNTMTSSPIYEDEYNSTLDLSSLNLNQGLYKIYFYFEMNDYITEDDLNNTEYDINDYITEISFNNFEVFSMNNFEWLNKDNNEDTSSNTLATKFMNSNKSYVAQAKYNDGYILTSKTFGAESKSIIETAIEAVSNTIVKAGDNITLVLIIFTSVTTMLFIFKRKIKKC